MTPDSDDPNETLRDAIADQIRRNEEAMRRDDAIIANPSSESAKRAAEGRRGKNSSRNADAFNLLLDPVDPSRQSPPKGKPRLFSTRLPPFDPEGDFLYGTYRLLFHSDAPLRNKQKAFESSALCDNSWFVTSISVAAAKRLLESRSPGGVRRAHWMSRVDRASAMFDRPEPLPKHDLLDFFFEHDSTTVVTTEENGVPGVAHWSELIPVPAGHFTSGSFKIRLRKSVELAWLQSQFASRF